MSNKRFAIFNTETGEIRKTGDDSILTEVISSNENIVPIETTTGQVAFVDTNASLSKSSVPETNKSNTADLYTEQIPGVIQYDIPQRLLASHDVIGRLILGG